MGSILQTVQTRCELQTNESAPVHAFRCQSVCYLCKKASVQTKAVQLPLSQYALFHTAVITSGDFKKFYFLYYRLLQLEGKFHKTREFIHFFNPRSSRTKAVPLTWAMFTKYLLNKWTSSWWDQRLRQRSDIIQMCLNTGRISTRRAWS